MTSTRPISTSVFVCVPYGLAVRLEMFEDAWAHCENGYTREFKSGFAQFGPEFIHFFGYGKLIL